MKDHLGHVLNFFLLLLLLALGFEAGWILRGSSNVLKAQPGAVIEMQSVPVQVAPADPFVFKLPDGSELIYDRRR